MADTKISDLTALAGASIDTAADLIPIVDVSAGTSGSKKTTVNDIKTALGISAFGATLIDDADAATARQTLGIPIEPLGYTTATSQPDIKLDNIFDDTKYSHYLITGWCLPATNNVTFVPTLRTSVPGDVSGGIIAGGVMTRLDSTTATFDAAQTSIAGSVANASHGGVTFDMVLTLTSGRNHKFFVRTEATQNGTSGAGNNVQGRQYLGWFVDTTLRQGIKFTFSSGNISSGWLNIEGVRK